MRSVLMAEEREWINFPVTLLARGIFNASRPAGFNHSQRDRIPVFSLSSLA
jgi:hypothetical protein